MLASQWPLLPISSASAQKKVLYSEANGENGEVSQRVGDGISPYLTIGAPIIVKKVRSPYSELDFYGVWK